MFDKNETAAMGIQINHPRLMLFIHIFLPVESLSFVSNVQRKILRLKFKGQVNFPIRIAGIV